MHANQKKSIGRAAGGCLAVVVLVVAVYYAAQIVLRTAPLTPLQAIPHRGGRAYQPENTLAAFRNAIDQGAGWLEFDVQMSSDGALVVIHDETVDRTTNGTGAVRELTFEQIRALDAGEGQKVPTFEEVVRLAKESGTKILPETKSAHLYPGLEEKMLAVLEQNDYLEQTVIQSFEAESLEKLRRLKPEVKLCALYGLWKFDAGSPAGDAQYVCPMAEMVLLNPGMIRQAHRAGRQVFVYYGVLENPFGVSAMRFFGADGLIVDDPLPLMRGE